jgi:hypothetical protein
MQTDQVAFARAISSWNLKTAVDSGYGTVTVVRDTPKLTTVASPAIEVGGELSTTGTLDGTNPDGSITFDLFGPGDPTCSGTPMHTDVAAVNGNGTYQSATVAASQAGTYRWTSTYGGDDDNDPVSSSCKQAAAATLVRSPPPTTATTATTNVTPTPSAPATGTPASGGGGEITGGTGGTGSHADAATAPLVAKAGTRVRLDGFKLSRKTFGRGSASTALTASAASAKKKSRAKGTTIKYTLSDPATVTMVVERSLKGRRSGSKCVKATAKLKRKKSCTRYVKSATLKRTYKSAGAKKLPFSGRAGRRAMPFGSYRIRATARAGTGTTSIERKATFKIVKR